MKLLFTWIGLFLIGFHGVLAQDTKEADGEASESVEVEGVAEGAPVMEEAAIPEAYPAARYQASWNKNPFLLKTAPSLQPTASFAQDWALGAMASHDGKVSVIIQNKQTGESKRLTTQDSAESEFRLIKANFSRNREEAFAEVAKGSEVAKLTYDENLTSKPVTINNTLKPPAAAPNQAATAPGQPGAAPVSPAGQIGRRAPGPPQMPVPGTPPAAQAGRPGVPVPPTISRRRQLVPAPPAPAPQP